jgi:transcriptional regulator GlxA family with amidase domain
MLDVTVLLLDDNFASTALGPVEVFHSAGLLWSLIHDMRPDPRFKVTTVSVDGQPIITSYGVRILPQAAMDDIERTDLVVVPSSGLALDAQVKRYHRLFPWLSDRYAHGSYIAGICSGVAFLAEAGLLDGRRATTHWVLGERYRERYPKVNWCTELFITEDRRVLCSGGVYAAIDLSLYLVEKFCGREVALQCAKSLLVDMPRAHQSGYAVLPLSRPHSDERIRETEDYMARHYNRDLPLKLLSERASMSARTFLRRFKAATGRLPGQYLQAQRVAIARELLENTARPVQAISGAVGYDDIAFFRKLFRRETGMTPAEYRDRFGGGLIRRGTAPVERERLAYS